MWTARGEKGGWEKLGDGDLHIHTNRCLYIKQVTNENLPYSAKNSRHCSVVTSVERKFRKEGIYVYTWLIHFALQQTLTQDCKATIPQ